MAVIFQYFGTIALVQLVFAAFVVYTAANFLKFQEWARRGLLILSYLAATYVISFSIFWIYMWISILTGAATNTASAALHQVVPPALFMIVGIIGGICNMVMFLIPTILSIIALKGPTVRDAFAQRRASLSSAQ